MAIIDLLTHFAALLIVLGAGAITLSLPKGIYKFFFRWAGIFVAVNILTRMFVHC